MHTGAGLSLGKTRQRSIGQLLMLDAGLPSHLWQQDWPNVCLYRWVLIYVCAYSWVLIYVHACIGGCL